VIFGIVPIVIVLVIGWLAVRGNVARIRQQGFGHRHGE